MSESIPKYTTHTCTLCNDLDNDDMVQCDGCDKWFHFLCVSLSNIDDQTPWNCKTCEDSKRANSEDLQRICNGNWSAKENSKSLPTHRNKINTKPTTMPRFGQFTGNTSQINEDLSSKHSSQNHESIRSTTFTARKKIELLRLEEEKLLQEKLDADALALKEKRERKFLEQKFQLLNEEVAENEGSSHRSSYTRKWVKDCNKYAKHFQSPFDNRGQQLKTTTKFENVDRVEGIESNLTRNQIAARQVVSKDLPLFNGNPEDWPMFISKFENSTKICGFSNDENLDRLQKSLKGSALDTVKERLLLPKCVPEVIKTLRMRFGRPDLIINNLIVKVRNEPTIKPDKLDAIINFAFKVRNLTGTIEAAGLIYHLTNPVLIQELVDKLPPQTKIEWARYMRKQQEVNLSTLSNWLYELAEEISTVTTPEIKSNHFDRKVERKPWIENKYINTHRENIENSGSTSFRKCIICFGNCKNVESCPKFNGLNTNLRWKVLYDNKLCRKCLRRHYNDCKSSKECGKNGCKFKHHFLLHDNEKHFMPQVNPRTGITPSSENDKNICNNHNIFKNDTLLRYIPIVIHHNGKSIKTVAFLDEGSTVTLLENRIVDELGITGTSEQLCLMWTGSMQRKEENSKRVNIVISGQGEFNQQYRLRNVRTVENLGLPIQSLQFTKLTSHFQHLKGIPLIDYKDVRPGILIGSDNARLGLQLEIHEGEIHSPIASKTKIGWSLHGPTSNPDSTFLNSHRVIECSCQSKLEEELHQTIKQFFSLENFGVQYNSNCLKSKDDEKATEMLKQLTIRKNQRFETGLLWRDNLTVIPNSYEMAKNRLLCLEKKGVDTISRINKNILEYIQKGYASKLSPDKLLKDYSRIWYLPIFTVINPKKPEKIRMVFDAAAKVKGVSLNSMLLTGPDQLASLLEILRRFREKKIAVCGDIREMFHQVSIREEDRNAQRFLWRNGNTNIEPDVYVMNVMTFGATCSPSAAQYVKNINALDFEKSHPRAVKSIIQNHYVDDMMDGEDTVSDAIQLINDVKTIHAHGGFEIRNFISNSSEVLHAIGETNKNEKNLDMNSVSGTEKVLGMWWDTKFDFFTFSLKYARITEEILLGTKIPTKREVLKILMSIFDPLGFLGFYLIYLKILLQDIWRSKISWDEQLSEIQFKKWSKWIDLLPLIKNLKIPRLYSAKLCSDSLRSIEAHVFVDASDEAFAAVAYLRVEDSYGVDCAIIGSKSRVVPLKYLSIPRKELQAAVLGARLLVSICKSQSFKITRKILWTDSVTVLSWLKSDHRNYSQFVAHRIGEILENTDITDWRWISSKNNVADEATKWSKMPTFDSSSRWFKGPEFLVLPETQWPKVKSTVYSSTTEELKAIHAHSELLITSIINPQRFSNWNRLVRALAYVIRFSTNLKSQIKKEPLKNGALTSEELLNSENMIFRQTQFEGFSEEMILLERNKIIPIYEQIEIKKPSPLYNCSPYLDSVGVMRVKGRIDLATEVSDHVKRPIILPRQHLTTNLLVNHYHRKFHHQNHETVINELRQRFYIPRLRLVLKKVRWSCQWCKNKSMKPIEPEMGNLPLERLSSHIRPFTYIGIDYFGPLEVLVGRRVEKRWGVLITCLTIRAIHIEIAHSLNTESCILCLRNFIARRGIPITIYSDNGTNFHGADNELKKELEKLSVEQLSEQFTSSYTRWMYNPPAAPHMGGSWERLIGLVKSNLKNTLFVRTPKDEVLRSLLLEIENIVNSRPLTYIPIESFEDEVLTPNHFLIGSSNGYKPPGNFNSSGIYFRNSWKEVQRITNLFWNRFIKEYIPTLIRRTKWFKLVKPIECGDIVLIIDKTNPRNTYPKARVLKVIIGSNGQVRRAKVQTADGLIFWRPAVKLAVLDIKKIDVDDGLANSHEN